MIFEEEDRSETSLEKVGVKPTLLARITAAIGGLASPQDIDRPTKNLGKAAFGHREHLGNYIRAIAGGHLNLHHPKGGRGGGANRQAVAIH